MPTLTIITPTIGRHSLATMLEALVPQLQEGDECLVLGDGAQPEAEQIVVSVPNPSVRYIEHALVRNWGNPQRNTAIGMAKGDLLVFIDDDDRPISGGMETIRRVAVLHPNRPLMFRMHHQGMLLPTELGVLKPGNVSGQMFVAPNVISRVGRWSDRYAADFDFIESTMKHYSLEDLVWCDEITTVQGFRGPG
jgi:glycosyltransferase involved in cell wall biosynthesis